MATVTTRTGGDRIFDVVNYTLMTIAMLAVVYPLYFVVIASFSDPAAIYEGEVYLVPRRVTLEGYEAIFGDPAIWRGYRNTIFYAVVGTMINLAVTIPAAYALSRKDLRWRNAIMFVFAFTMIFNGGIIPTFLVVRSVGMINTFWAMLIPQALIVWNLIVARTFFQQTIPEDLLDAARIDGATNETFFFRIVLPLSTALIAIMVLFYGVFHWNSFFDALIYLRDAELYPLQLVLRDILIQNELSDELAAQGVDYSAHERRAELIKYGTIMVASAPVLVLYPFLQRYFVKGVMIGALKG